MRNVTRSGNIGDESPSEPDRNYWIAVDSVGLECLAARIPRLVVLDPAASPGLQCPRESGYQVIRNMLVDYDLVDRPERDS